MTWLDTWKRARRHTGPKLQSRHSGPEPSVSPAEPWDVCSKVYIIESSKWRNSPLRDALEYVKDLEADPDTDDFAIVWARHELQRRIQAAKQEILRDG